MKKLWKRLLPSFMSLVMVLTLLPTMALADESSEGNGAGAAPTAHKDHNICCCDEYTCTDPSHRDEDYEHTANEITDWTAVADEDGLKQTDTSKTHYLYLADNVQISSKWTINTGVNIVLCLNGKTLTANNNQNNVFDIIMVNGTLTITDCTDEGKITGAYTGDSDSRKAIQVAKDGTLNLYAGSITGINAGIGSGGGVHNRGIFNMYGGSITGNTAKKGGGVFNWNGTFNMYGGYIGKNTANGTKDGTDFSAGNDVHNQTVDDENNTNPATINANGGEIAGNVYNYDIGGCTITTADGYDGTTFDGAVTNSGTISGGGYNGEVTNNGTITGGEFYSAVTNKSGSTVTGTSSIINNSVFVFESGSTKTGDLAGYGFVQVGTGENAAYYDNDGSASNNDYAHYYDQPKWSEIINNQVEGCEWDSATNTLTLTNVQINKLYVGADGANEVMPNEGTEDIVDPITVVIDGNVAVHTLWAMSGTDKYNYAGTLTIKGKTGRETDTLYSGNYIEIDTGALTLEGLTARLSALRAYNSGKDATIKNCEVTFDLCVDIEMTVGNVRPGENDGYRTLKLENSYMKMDGAAFYNANGYRTYIFAESITMDDTSTLVLQKAYLNNFARVLTGLNGLKTFLPKGFSIVCATDEDGYSYNTLYKNNSDTSLWRSVTLKKYKVNFDLNGGTVNGASEMEARCVVGGTAVSDFDTPTKSGYTFAGWYTAAEGGTKVTEVSSELFDPKEDSFILYAHWTRNSSGNTTTVTVPVTSDHDTVEVKATVSKGNATVKVSDKQVEQVIEDGAGEVTLDVSGLKNVESATVPAHVVEKTNAAENTGLTVALPAGSVTLDETALESVTEAADGKDVTVSVVSVPTSKLPTAVKDIIGMEPTVVAVVDVNVTVGGVKQSSFDGGKVTISVPYTPKAGEDTSKLTVWFIRDDGTIENKGGYYDAEKKCFVFETEHLSQYLLVNTNELVSFTDVPADAWYAAAVNWAVKNEITGGIGNDQFGPDLSCTRAQLVTFLYRAAVAQGVDTSVGADTNILSYNDALEIPEYAVSAFQWAVGAGIVQGYDGALMPNDDCTRGQIVTMLYRFAVAAGKDVSVGEDTNILSYADFASVPEYAVAPFQWATGVGIIRGADGKLMPNDTCTRGQIVTMLYRLLGE